MHSGLAPSASHVSPAQNRLQILNAYTGHLAASISEMPFPLEHWEDFEKLLVALAIGVDGPIEVRRYGTSGQEQDGIDVIGFTRRIAGSAAGSPSR